MRLIDFKNILTETVKEYGNIPIKVEIKNQLSSAEIHTGGLGVKKRLYVTKAIVISNPKYESHILDILSKIHHYEDIESHDVGLRIIYGEDNIPIRLYLSKEQELIIKTGDKT